MNIYLAELSFNLQALATFSNCNLQANHYFQENARVISNPALFSVCSIWYYSFLIIGIILHKFNELIKIPPKYQIFL